MFCFPILRQFAVFAVGAAFPTGIFGRPNFCNIIVVVVIVTKAVVVVVVAVIIIVVVVVVTFVGPALVLGVLLVGPRE